MVTYSCIRSRSKFYFKYILNVYNNAFKHVRTPRSYIHIYLSILDILRLRSRIIMYVRVLSVHEFNPLDTMHHYSGFRGCHLLLRRVIIVAHSTDSFAHRLT